MTVLLEYIDLFWNLQQGFIAWLKNPPIMPALCSMLSGTQNYASIIGGSLVSDIIVIKVS